MRVPIRILYRNVGGAQKSRVIPYDTVKKCDNRAMSIRLDTITGWVGQTDRICKTIPRSACIAC